MPSSSAYAAPIDLDLRPGQWERGGRVVAGALALGALMLAALPVLVKSLGVAIVAWMLVRDSVRASSRSPRMRLHEDGSVECAVPNEEALQAATLLQATSYLGLTQLRWADSDDRHHACMLFPDRLDANTRHGLRVWLATHRPEGPSGAIPAGSAPQ